MSALLSCLLSIIIGSSSPTVLKSETVSLAKLPEECVAEYNSFLRKDRNADSTLVIKYDIDGDGVAELLVWTGDGGSGGEIWSVMRYEGGKYHRVDQIFGILFAIDSPKHRGLLVCTPCGWDSATWSYYQLTSGKLREKLEIDVVYSRPVRECPTEIRIKYIK